MTCSNPGTSCTAWLTKSPPAPTTMIRGHELEPGKPRLCGSRCPPHAITTLGQR